MAGKQVHSGRCRCGLTAIEVHGEAAATMYCHCTDCRRATGAPVLASVGFFKTDINWTEDSTVKRHTIGTATRVFCEECGTPIAQEHESKDDIIFVNTGYMDSPENFPPSYHSFGGQQLSWLKLEDDLERIEKTRFIKTE